MLHSHRWLVTAVLDSAASDTLWSPEKSKSGTCVLPDVARALFPCTKPLHKRSSAQSANCTEWRLLISLISTCDMCGDPDYFRPQNRNNASLFVTAKRQAANTQLDTSSRSYVLYLLFIKEIEILKSFLEIVFFWVLDLINSICVGRWGAGEERFLFLQLTCCLGKSPREKELHGGEREESSRSPILPMCWSPPAGRIFWPGRAGILSGHKLTNRMTTLTDVIEMCFEKCKVKTWRRTWVAQ